jgi:hypothetical protein
MSDRNMHYFLRIIFAIVAFCGITSVSVDASVLRASECAKEECVVQDGRKDNLELERALLPVSTAAISPRNLQRIGGSRPTRLIPTHSGKPSRIFGKWIAGYSFNLSNQIHYFLRHAFLKSKSGAASPRFYYVIALRRILC